MSQLEELINKLSKSSPQAVFTLAQGPAEVTVGTDIFSYLYIKTELEKSYIKQLDDRKGKKCIIFVCGSSGDGKSAIIGRNADKFVEHYDIHIDATHSFSPSETAIDALNKRFSRFKSGNKSLIVGINIGVLLNYAREGSDEHNDIRNAIHGYISEGFSIDEVMFINFEDYSKFEMNHDKITSSFIHHLIDKVVSPTRSNPFFHAFQEDKQDGCSGQQNRTH